MSQSPYFRTGIVDDYLDVIDLPGIETSSNDEYYTVESKFNNRPDLLSQELYGTTRLWWVFQRRNMNEIKDPIRDFKAGLTIRIPRRSAVARFMR
tara:strand:- start:3411 stop:3695 length:285 start_codon:yes stop_codon:yes gene_type:complete